MDRVIGDVSEDFLTCSLCKDDYTDPRSLPCLHAFCRNCIAEHISKSLKGQRAPKGFGCPICKRLVDAPDPHQPPSSWADMLPLSHLINSLMDGVKLRNDVSKCDPCYRRREKVIAAKWCKECAEALCEQCVSFHRSLKYSQNHTLMEFEDLRQQPIKNTLPRPPCPTHENTTLGFFCEDHQKVCCSSCVTVNHRKCSHVTTSVDAAAKHKIEVDALMEKLRQQNGWSARILENRQHSVKILDDAESQLKNQITSLRGQFDEMLMNQEKKILEELRLLKSKEKREYEKEITKCEEMICTTGNALNIIKNSMQHGTDSDILLSVNSVKKEARACDKVLTEMSGNLRDILLIFTPNKDLSNMLSTMKEIGKISFSHSRIQVAPPYNIAIPSSPDSLSPETERLSQMEIESPVEKPIKRMDETPRSSRMSRRSRSDSRHGSRASRHSHRSHDHNQSSTRLNLTNLSKAYDDTPRSKTSKMSDIFAATLESMGNESPRNQTIPSLNQSLLSPMTPMGRISDRRIASNPASLEFFFKARSVQDRENCILTGATYLLDGRVVLVDQMLRKLKLFDQNYHWTGEKVLPARPYDICNVNENEVAVTFPREKRIQVFSGEWLWGLSWTRQCYYSKSAYLTNTQ